MERLKEKIALVTGGASGLGRAIAQRLVSEGARVVITDIQEAPGQAAAAEFACEFLPQDVTDETQWSRVMTHLKEQHGGLHILVNNAGITGPMDAVSPEDTRLSDWRKVFAVNAESVFLGCRAGIPAIHASGGGSIINIASVTAVLASPYGTAYGASKAVVRQLTKSVAQYCAEKKMKIRCNSVHPGIVRTPLWDTQAELKARTHGVPFDDYVRQRQSIVPMGDFTQTKDVAAAVAYLASDDSRHVTGTKLIVDGGLMNCDSYHWVDRSA